MSWSLDKLRSYSLFTKFLQLTSGIFSLVSGIIRALKRVAVAIIAVDDHTRKYVVSRLESTSLSTEEKEREQSTLFL